MGIISVSLPSDGTTADVADVNTPLTTIATEINGNLDNNNIKAAAAIDGSKLADASITNSKFATTAGQPGGSWTTWTPTWTSNGSAPAIGNGTLTGAYTQIGKTIHFRIKFIGGSTTTWGSGLYYITLPIAPWSGVAANDSVFMSGYGEDAGVTGIAVQSGRMFDTTKTYIIMHASAGNSNWSATYPFTWSTGDYWSATGTYEAA